MNKKRLLKLADFLETVPREKFNLNHWVTALPTKPEGREEGECGFAGCAMGWAAHAKLFPELKFDRWNMCNIVYYGNTGWTAPRKLFGISDASARHLFSDDAYR